jgi:hypothetical protein
MFSPRLRYIGLLAKGTVVESGVSTYLAVAGGRAGCLCGILRVLRVSVVEFGLGTNYHHQRPQSSRRINTETSFASVLHTICFPGFAANIENDCFKVT